jgi:hypothetical protein
VKLTFTGEHGINVTAENPDERISKYFRDKIAEAYHAEIQAFLEEVAVAIRKLEPGQTVTVESKPMKVMISSPPTEQPKGGT